MTSGLKTIVDNPDRRKYNPIMPTAISRNLQQNSLLGVKATSYKICSLQKYVYEKNLVDFICLFVFCITCMFWME